MPLPSQGPCQACPRLGIQIVGTRRVAKRLARYWRGPYFPIPTAATPTRMQQTTTIGYDTKLETDVICTKLDAALNWFRTNSIWPMPMGLACCAIELMATGAARYDISRFGAEVMRFSPRQSDLLIVAGTVTYKMATACKRIYGVDAR